MYIYKITNKQNNKVYIGRTVYGVGKRFQAHWKAAQNGDKCHLHLSMRKYGIKNFTIEQIDTANSIEELSKEEAFWVSYYDAYNTGYNMTLRGDSNPMECTISKTRHNSRMRDPKVRKKISDSMKAYKKEHPVTERTRIIHTD